MSDNTAISKELNSNISAIVPNNTGDLVSNNIANKAMIMNISDNRENRRGRRRRTIKNTGIVSAARSNNTTWIDIFGYQEEFLNQLIKREKHPFSGFFVVNSSIQHLLNRAFLYNSFAKFDIEWYNNSLAYLNQLPNIDKFRMYAYTYNGDELVNALIRNPANFDNNSRIQEIINNKILSGENNVIAAELFNKHNIDWDTYIDKMGRLTIDGAVKAHNLVKDLTSSEIKEYIVLLGNELKRIVKNAPKTTKIIPLFRGVRDDYLTAETTADIFSTSGFQSSTYAIESAISFTSAKKIIYMFIVQSNVPCLLMGNISKFAHEHEVLIDMDAYIRVEKPRKLSYIGDNITINKLIDPIKNNAKLYNIRDIYVMPSNTLNTVRGKIIGGRNILSDNSVINKKLNNMTVRRNTVKNTMIRHTNKNSTSTIIRDNGLGFVKTGKVVPASIEKAMLEFKNTYDKMLYERKPFTGADC